MGKKLLTIFLILFFPFASAGSYPSEYPCPCCFPNEGPRNFILSMPSEWGMECCHDRFKTEAKAPPCCGNRSLEDEKAFLMQAPIVVSCPDVSGFPQAHLSISPDHEDQIGSRRDFPQKRSKNIYIQNLSLRC